MPTEAFYAIAVVILLCMGLAVAMILDRNRAREIVADPDRTGSRDRRSGRVLRRRGTRG